MKERLFSFSEILFQINKFKSLENSQMCLSNEVFREKNILFKVSHKFFFHAKNVYIFVHGNF